MQQTFCQPLIENLLTPSQRILFADIELHSNLTYVKYLFSTPL